MIQDSSYSYYIVYAVMIAALMVTFIKVQSLEGVTVTTKEFKKFQYSFLGGYGTLIAIELIAIASFYHVMVSLNLNIEQITNIYITTIIATTLWDIVLEIFDLGSRKTKCFMSAALYAISLFTLFFGGHYEMIMISRVIYGAAAALHHSSLEGYLIHQHTILGFPDDWLTQTFSMLPHVMTIAAGSAGPLGQIAGSTGGTGGIITIIILLSAVAMMHIMVNWEKDTNPPRFMWSNCVYTFTNTFNTMKQNKMLSSTVFLGACFESSILIFNYYWAPWLHSVITNESGTWAGLNIQVEEMPYEIIFATYMCASMLGNYFYVISTHDSTNNNNFIFHYVLLGSTMLYLIAAYISHPLIIFGLSLSIHLCMGAYWSCIGMSFIYPVYILLYMYLYLYE